MGTPVIEKLRFSSKIAINHQKTELCTPLLSVIVDHNAVSKHFGCQSSKKTCTTEKKFKNVEKSLFDKGEKMVKVQIDYSKCTGNGERLCVEICPVSVFNEKKSGKPEVVNVENCILCRTCQVNCPSQAILVLS
jgi:NAD-dependent dihydropyrimidine dehydrogenase PreA subunit